MRKKQVMAILLIGILLAFFSVFLIRLRPQGRPLSTLTCTFLKVGKADAIVVEMEDHTMVIDTGEEDDGQELVDFLKKRNRKLVDALIITHFDRDHVGGADTLLAGFPVARVLIPDYEGSSAEYTDFISSMGKTSISPERLSSSLTFAFGEAMVTVDPPGSYEIPAGAVEYDNNFSLITTITLGSNRMYFTGDIEKERIQKLLENESVKKCIFLKVPHHGIYNTALEDLIKVLNPKYAVICSSDKHPAENATLELLKAYGVNILETRHGNVTLISDGEHLELHQEVE